MSGLHETGVQTENESGERRGCEIYYFCRSGEDNADEDKVGVNPENGMAVVVDMMGGHGRGYRVITMADAKEEIMSKSEYAFKIMGEKSISSSDEEQDRRIEGSFGQYQTAASWAGDKLAPELIHGLGVMNDRFTNTADLERDLRSVARAGNEVLGRANSELHKMGLPKRTDETGDTGGTAVFGKLVTVNGERHWAGLRIGDVRVGIRRANGKMEILPCDGMSIENYVAGKFNSLEEYLSLRNRTSGALIGREDDLKKLKFVDIPVGERDQIIFLTDGITDSLECVVKPTFRSLDPWEVLKEIWNNWNRYPSKPEMVIRDLADRSAWFTELYKESLGNGKKERLIVENCLPKHYVDDQAGVLMVVGKEVVARRNKRTLIEMKYPTTDDSEKLRLAALQANAVAYDKSFDDLTRCRAEEFFGERCYSLFESAFELPDWLVSFISTRGNAQIDPGKFETAKSVLWKREQLKYLAINYWANDKTSRPHKEVIQEIFASMEDLELKPKMSVDEFIRLFEAGGVEPASEDSSEVRPEAKATVPAPEEKKTQVEGGREIKTEVGKMVASLTRMMKEARGDEEISLNIFTWWDLLRGIKKATKDKLMMGARELYPDKKTEVALAQMYADIVAIGIEQKAWEIIDSNSSDQIIKEYPQERRLLMWMKQMGKRIADGSLENWLNEKRKGNERYASMKDNNELLRQMYADVMTWVMG